MSNNNKFTVGNITVRVGYSPQYRWWAYCIKDIDGVRYKAFTPLMNEVTKDNFEEFLHFKELQWTKLIPRTCEVREAPTPVCADEPAGYYRERSNI